MASTTFIDKVTVINNAWLNDVNGVVWTLFGGATSASAGRTALGLGTLATQNANAVAITGGTISGLTSLTGLLSPLQVADGGTGAVNAAGARTQLVAAKSGANSDITALSGLTTPLSVAQGGTGAATLPSFNVMIGNGTSPVTFVAPATSGNILTSNGTAWLSSAPPSSKSYIKAWIKFDGTPTGAYPITLTPAAGESYNITNVTKHGVGQFTLNFSPAFPDTNYVVTGMAGDTGSASIKIVSGPRTSAPTTTTFRFTVTDATPTNADAPYIYMMVTGN